MSQPLSNKLGNAIGECKRRMLDRVKQGLDLETAIVNFFSELRLEMDRILVSLRR